MKSNGCFCGTKNCNRAVIDKQIKRYEQVEYIT